MITLPIWLLILIGLFGLPLLVIIITLIYTYIKIVIEVIKLVINLIIKEFY